MYQMWSYDFAEAMRSAQQWMGTTARTVAQSPFLAPYPNPMLTWMGAWGEVTERSFERITHKPDWGIEDVSGENEQDHFVQIDKVLRKPFCDLLHFNAVGRPELPRKILLIAPMSGHYATLLRSTVKSLLFDCEVYVTDWKNARDIPVSEGRFDIEDYVEYLVEFMRYIGPDVHAVAVCQPAPLTLAATAHLCATEPKAKPTSVTLIGGPVDPTASKTDVTEFGERMGMRELEAMMIQQVGFRYRGVGRRVYPGLLQLSSFMAMNASTHSKSFSEQIFRVSQGLASDHDKHNKFYDEYLAVMDMPAEFYLSTVKRIFKDNEIGENKFTLRGRPVDISAIRDVSIMTIEGGRDDISSPGQCVAALELCDQLPKSRKVHHLEPDAGHYGIFAGSKWRSNIRPKVIGFMDQASIARGKNAKSAA